MLILAQRSVLGAWSMAKVAILFKGSGEVEEILEQCAHCFILFLCARITREIYGNANVRSISINLLINLFMAPPLDVEVLPDDP